MVDELVVVVSFTIVVVDELVVVVSFTVVEVAVDSSATSDPTHAENRIIKNINFFIISF